MTDKITGENVPRVFIRWATDKDGCLRIRKWSQGPHEGAVEYLAIPETDQSGLKAMFDAIPSADPAPADRVVEPVAGQVEPGRGITFDHIERMMHAVEGECEGLEIDAGQAMAILAYVFEESCAPRSAEVPPVDRGIAAPMKMVNSRTNDPYPEGWSIDIVHLSIHRTNKTHSVGYGFEVGLEAYVQDRIRAALSATEADHG